jgi:hypothetical protein
MSVHYIIQNTNHQQMHKESYIGNRNKLLRVSTLLGHLQGEFPLPVSPGPRRVHASKNNAVHSQQHILAQLQPDRGEFTPPKRTQYTINSTFSLNCKAQP